MTRTPKGKGKGTRGPYEKNGCTACASCQKAKSRCVGTPVCERCQLRGEICIRGEDGRSQIVTKARIQSYEEKIKAQDEELDYLRARLSQYEQVGSHQAGENIILQAANDALEERRNNVISRLGCVDENQSDADTEYQDPVQSDTDDEESSTSDSESSDGFVETRSVSRKRGLTASANPADLDDSGLTAVFRFLRRSRSERALRKLQKYAVEPSNNERYVLVLPGTTTPPSCSCSPEDECWRRYLPKDVPLNRTEHDLLLHRFFFFYTPWCMRLIPEYFLRDMHRYIHSAPIGSHSPSASPIDISNTPHIGQPTTPTSPSHPRPGSHTYRPTTVHYSPFLHLAVLAVASAFSDNPEISSSSTRARFAEEAKKLIEEECKVPNIAAVQALGMLGSYFSGIGQQTLGFIYAGMACRVSQALGLSTDCSQWVESGRIKPQDLLDRLWCYHMVCAHDACWSLYVGREFGVPSCTLDPLVLSGLAAPILDSLNSTRWNETPSSGDTTAPGPTKAKAKAKEGSAQTCNSFTTFLWTCRLMKVSRQIMTLMNILSSGGGGHEVIRFVADIDIQLISWYEELPPELRVNLKRQEDVTALPALIMMHLAFRWLLILLHRPFFRRQSGTEVDFSYKRCTVAAREILTLLSIWRRLYGASSFRFVPITLVQTVFAAGTVYLLTAQHAATGRSPAPQAHAAAMEGVEKAVDVLREVGVSWGSARRIVRVFESLIAAQRKLIEGGVRRTIRGNGKAPAGALKRKRKTKAEQNNIAPAVRVDQFEMQASQGSDSSPSSQELLVYDNRFLSPTQVCYPPGSPPQQQHILTSSASEHECYTSDGHSDAEHHGLAPDTGINNLGQPVAWSDNEHSDVAGGDQDFPMTDVEFWRFLQTSLAPPAHVRGHKSHSSTDSTLSPFAQTMPLHPTSNAPPNAYASPMLPPANVSPWNSLSGWNVTGTGLSMENGTGFADPPFMAFDTWSSSVHGTQHYDPNPGQTTTGSPGYNCMTAGFGQAFVQGYGSDVPYDNTNGINHGNNPCTYAGSDAGASDIEVNGVEPEDQPLFNVIRSLYIEPSSHRTYS